MTATGQSLPSGNEEKLKFALGKLEQRLAAPMR
jgi:hypothetical protein